MIANVFYFSRVNSSHYKMIQTEATGVSSQIFHWVSTVWIDCKEALPFSSKLCVMKNCHIMIRPSGSLTQISDQSLMINHDCDVEEIHILPPIEVRAMLFMWRSTYSRQSAIWISDAAWKQKKKLCMPVRFSGECHAASNTRTFFMSSITNMVSSETDVLL